jgi:hypothetical protein
MKLILKKEYEDTNPTEKVDFHGYFVFEPGVSRFRTGVTLTPS